MGIFSFDQPSLVIRDLEFVKDILVKDTQYFIDHVMDLDEKVNQLHARSIFALNGQRWRHVRTNLTPVFTSGKMKMFDLVEICSKDLIHYLGQGIFKSIRYRIFLNPAIPLTMK